jgi:hypothetical protein
MIKNKEFKDLFDEIGTLIVPPSQKPKDEPVFYVNLNTRKIEIPANFKNLAVCGDHQAETIWFLFDRYFDGVDLASEQKHFAVQFENNQFSSMHVIQDRIYTFDGNGVNDKDLDRYEKIDKNQILVGWILKSDITSVPGPLKFSLRIFSGDVETQTYTYSLNTETATVNIVNSLNVTDITENLNPPMDTLSSLVNYIAELYRNQEVKGIEWVNVRNKPQIDGNDINGNMSSLSFACANYNNLSGKPTIDGTEIKGELYSSMFKNIDFEQIQNVPKLNGEPLEPGQEIVIQVDNAFSDKSENSVQNKVLTARFKTAEGAIEVNSNNIASHTQEIKSIKEQLQTLTFIPIAISNFRNDLNVVELNDTSSKTIHFTWETSKEATNSKINGVDASSPYTLNTSIDRDTTFTLTVKGVSSTDIASATTEVKVVKGIFYGAATLQDTYSESFLRELSGKILSTESEHIFTVDAGTDLDKYIYIAAPAADLYELSVNGFMGGFTLVDDSVTLYNNVQYKIYKSDNKNLGITKVKLS